MLANIFDDIDVIKSVDGPAQPDTSADKIEEFIHKANSFHQTNQVYGWNLRSRNYILGHESVQSQQTDRELSIHEFLLVSLTRRHERIYQRGSIKASENKFLSFNFWGKYEKLRDTP